MATVYPPSRSRTELVLWACGAHAHGELEVQAVVGEPAVPTGRLERGVTLVPPDGMRRARLYTTSHADSGVWLQVFPSAAATAATEDGDGRAD